MEVQYQLLEEIASGSYGTVFRAKNVYGDIFAIKKLTQRFDSWLKAQEQTDIRNLLKMPYHPHVCQLLDHYFLNEVLYLVFEYFPFNLLTFIQQNKRLHTLQVRNISFCLLQGLAHVHASRFVHRDLKPENIMIDPISDDLSVLRLQIIDFGNCKQLLPNHQNTNYISTRWYRAPEQLLGSTSYDYKVDVFAAGCVICELLSGCPIFPGTSELDQIVKLLEVLGLPNKRILDKTQLKLDGYRTHAVNQTKENIKMLTNASDGMADLLSKMITWEAGERYAAWQCLQHPVFQ
ncbi:Kinase [Hexamita inflata]|uniref:CMGC RCK n=1 Tax=Hexamita inflata TaxID=28002 RepID=A0AA86P749_9EUKA|nr:CMGC RCK [Hexamita inflata]